MSTNQFSKFADPFIDDLPVVLDSSLPPLSQADSSCDAGASHAGNPKCSGCAALDRHEQLPERAPLRLRLFGSPCLLAESGEAKPLERKAAGLLAYLILKGKTPRSRLSALLWPESGDAAARNNLAQTLRRLRQASPDHSLVEGQSHLSLAEDFLSDLGERMRARREGRRTEIAAQDDELLADLDYSDCSAFNDWLQAQRDRLAKERHAALEELADAAESEGDLRAALGFAKTILELDPYSESDHRRLMRLLWLAGDRKAALAAFRQCREQLQQELGVEPDAETIALERVILRGQPPLQPARAGRCALPPSLLRPPRLAGRKDLLAAMNLAWEKGEAIFIEAGAGLGKTRLMQDFMGNYGRFYTFHGQAGETGIPLASIARFLREIRKAFPGLALPEWVGHELARLNPEPGRSPVTPGNEFGRLRLFQAVAEAIGLARNAGMRRAAFDDLQFLDSSSLAAILFAETLHGQGEGGLRTVFCFREAEMHPAAKALLTSTARAERALLVRLAPLSAAELGEMLEGIDPELAALGPVLHRHSGGNPLYALDTLRTMQGTGSLYGHPGGPLPISRRVRELVRQHLTALSPQALQLARRLALGGERLDADQAKAAMGIDHAEFAVVWEELTAARLIARGSFAQGITRQIILDDLPEPLHERLSKCSAAACH